VDQHRRECPVFQASVLDLRYGRSPGRDAAELLGGLRPAGPVPGPGACPVPDEGRHPRGSRAAQTGDRGGGSARLNRRSPPSVGFCPFAIPVPPATRSSARPPSSVADKLVEEYPRAGFKDELARTNIGEWAEESVAICLKTVYRDLDPEITSFANAPVAYETDAMR